MSPEQIATKEQEVKANKKAEKAAKAQAKADAPKKDRTSKAFPEASKVTLISTANPKRVGSKSHTRFEAYSKSGTVGEFIKNGGTYGDLAWDSARGFITIEGYTPKMVEKKAKAVKPAADAKLEEVNTAAAQ